MEVVDQPNSICHIKPTQIYPLSEDKKKIDLPFDLLTGESVKHYGDSVDGMLVLTTYRLYLQLRERQHHIPLGLIEIVEQRELFHLHIGCKDARTYRCTFDNNEICLDWYGNLLKASAAPRHLEEIFAFCHYVWSKEKGGEEILAKIDSQKTLVYDDASFKSEVNRMEFDIHGSWRISFINESYKLCSSYPPLLLVPSCISDDKLEIVAKFRSSRRIPTVVWRHSQNGAVIARCSQPEVGWLGWRSADDEDLIKAISDACVYDRGSKTMLDKESVSYSPTSNNSEDSDLVQKVDNKETKKVLIMDARSYTTAVANRARGGGCECPEYYPCCEIQFMNLANIHSIRKSFHALRQLCTSSADQPNWYSQLEGTRWLQHMSGVIRAAVTLITAVDREARPVLVHCSDGWDRTPQIVALAELLLDPFYRTIEGFRILIEREWLAFGHKFADRCGHATGSEDQNERCPVFLQWLDCVHQLHEQFQCHFEFSHTYLVKLAQHVYSNLYGTFLCNTKQERMERASNTFSVWTFLNSPCFRNHLYKPQNLSVPKVLYPQCNVRDLRLWSEVYLGSLELLSTGDTGSGACPGPPDSIIQHMIKTRSYGDLPNAADGTSSHLRRNSDSSITVESIKISSLNISSDMSGEAPSNNTDWPNQSLLTDNIDGRNTPTNGDFLCNNIDCIFNDVLTSAVQNVNLIDEPGEFSSSSEQKYSNHDNKYTLESEVPTNVIDDKTEEPEFKKLEEVANFESILLNQGKVSKSEPKPLKGDINHNGDVKHDDLDSDTECTSDPSESTLCDILRKTEKSVETSTETLVAENVICSSSPIETNGFEKLYRPDICNGNSDCKVCELNYVQQIHGHSGSTSGKTSRYSTPPPYSRTPSANGWDNSLMLVHKNAHSYQCNLGDDGLVPLKCDMQERLCQIIEEHRLKEEELKRELHTYRQALIKQVCHKCNHNEADCNYDSSDSESSEAVRLSRISPAQNTENTLLTQRKTPPHMSSVVESVCSAGEGQASAVESLRSDMSWEALEEGATLHEGTPTLWVPDHAVSRCTGCHTEFWLGRRKHHCRNCGRIFCADCSENSTPLPSEHLYDPVRVCTSCFCKLRRDCDEIPDQCKHSHSQAANNNPQITASSN